MALEELDGLFNDIAEADRATVKAILERNPNAVTRLNQRETVYTAFVDGDTAKLATVTAPSAATATQTTPAFDLDALNKNLDERFGKFNTDFDSRVEARAKAIAEPLIRAGIEQAVARSLKGGAEITTILHNHRQTYGKELDQTAYEKFVTDNPGKFISLTAAYEAFTENDRIEKIKADAFAAGQAARATNEVPGVSQPGSPVASMFLKSNPMNAGAAAQRGDGIDAAANAFRALRESRVN